MTDELRAQEVLDSVRAKRSCDAPVGNVVSIGCAIEAMLAFHTEASSPDRDTIRREALEKIRDHCQRLRNGTDDWFDLVEIQAICTSALSTTTEGKADA